MNRHTPGEGDIIAAILAAILGAVLVALVLIPTNTARPPAPPVPCIAVMVPGVEYTTAELCVSIRPQALPTPRSTR